MLDAAARALSRARALLVTGDNPVSGDILSYAARKGVVVLTCHQDTATASTLIRCSRTVRHVMEKKFLTLSVNEPISRLRKSLSSIDQDLFPVVEHTGGKMIGVIAKSDLVDPPRIRIALVDHNEYAQAVNGVEEAEITEVIDHHRLAGDLGPTSRAMILRNHGLLTLGTSISEAIEFMYYLECACQIQVDSLSAGREGVTLMTPDVIEKGRQQFNRPNRESANKHWPALLRMLDRRGSDYMN